VYCTGVVLVRDKWRALVNTAMNVRFPHNVESFLTS
jgi:hypothetical protein